MAARRRLPLLAVGAAAFFLAAALMIVGGALALAVFDDDEGAPAIERPAAAGTGAEPETQSLDETEALPPAPKPRSRPPKQTRRTPSAASVDLVTSSDAAPTEMQPATDSRGGGDAFALFQNALVNKGSAIYIAEPNVASKGDRMLVVWNHGAAFSSDAGRTFQYVDPHRVAPEGADYCCDQVVAYVPSHDLWVWFIQYDFLPNSQSNIVRIGVARGDAAFDRREFSFRTFNVTDFPAVGVPEALLDYPNLSFTRQHLYLAINVFSNDRYAGTIVMRAPLDQLASPAALTWRYVANGLGSTRLASGATETMYFAQHLDTTTLRVWRWPDNADSPVSKDVTHSQYPYQAGAIADSLGVNGYTCPREGATSGDFCKRDKGGTTTNDDRIGSAWIAGNTLGFAWNATLNRELGFPYPFAMVVRLDASTLTVKDEPFIWSPNHAYQYATIAANARGDLGGVAIAGGGRHYWTCATLMRDGPSGEAWEARAVDVSDADAALDETGDFLGAVPTRPGANTWTGTCMALHGGGRYRDVEVRLLTFGRAAERAE